LRYPQLAFSLASSSDNLILCRLLLSSFPDVVGGTKDFPNLLGPRARLPDEEVPQIEKHVIRWLFLETWD
jgi:hypothetical protein